VPRHQSENCASTKSMKRYILEDILLGMAIWEKNKFTPLTIQTLICDLIPKAKDCATYKKKKIGGGGGGGGAVGEGGIKVILAFNGH
jgi:hypothetical protein